MLESTALKIEQDCRNTRLQQVNPAPVQYDANSRRTLNSETWVIEEPAERLDIPQRLDIWVIPFGQSDHQQHATDSPSLTIIFTYYRDDFIDFEWLRAMKRFAGIMGIDDYSPDELRSWLYEALLLWEDNVDKHPRNPIIISKLAEAYADLGDLTFEIAGWWRLFERHPTQLSFLNMLHRACVAKDSISPGLGSLISFTRLCALYLMSRKSQMSGWGYLDWWPLAGEDEMMILQPYFRKRLWKNVCPIFRLTLLTN